MGSREGQAVHMDGLKVALEKDGHAVILVGPARTARLKFGDGDGPVALLKRTLPRAVYELLEFAYNIVAVPRLWSAIRRHRPDAIYERYNLCSMAGSLLRGFCGTPRMLEINARICEERAAFDGLALRRFPP